MASQQPRGPRSGIAIDTAALRQARLDAGLSLAEVAGSDLTRQAVHLIETGKVRPSARSLRIIAGRLAVPEAAFVVAPGPQSDERVIAELEELCRRQAYAQAVDGALGIVRLGGSPERVAFAHHYAGLALCVLARPAEALPHLRAARERFEVIGNPWWVAESMDWEAMALNSMENPGALRLCREALRRYRLLDPRRPETEARMLEHLGTVHYARRDYERALTHYDAALAVPGGLRELARIARVYHGKAMCYQGLRDLAGAADLLFKAITLYEAEQRIAGAPVRTDMARAENDLGLLWADRGDWERAESLFRAALDHFTAAGVERMRSHVMLSLGELRQRQGRLDEALELVLEAIERAVVHQETYAVAAGYRQLGDLYAARRDHHLADAAFQRALGLLDDAGLEDQARDCMRAYERVLAERRQIRRPSRRASA